MRVIKTKVYQYDELSPKAQAKAREWWVDLDNAYFDSSLITELYQRELEELGYPTDNIEWSLGYSQGDGMAFYGTIDLDAWTKATKTRSKFKALRDKDGRWMVSAELSKNSYGWHYSHWNTMDVEVQWTPEDYSKDPTAKQSEAMNALYAALKEHVQDTSRRLERLGYDEIEYQQSDEVVAETLIVNEYEFTEDGKPV